MIDKFELTNILAFQNTDIRYVRYARYLLMNKGIKDNDTIPLFLTQWLEKPYKNRCVTKADLREAFKYFNLW